MAAEIDSVNWLPRDKENAVIPNGKKTLLPFAAPKLKLDSLFDEKSDLSDIFELNELPNVVDLSIQYNNLSKLPTNLARNLYNLTAINLSNNNLRGLDESLECLKNLQQLIADRNKLEELPSYIGRLFNLRSVSAKGNKLRALPESLGNLENLEEVDFSTNKIESIPETWAKLINLRTLKLAHNELRNATKCVIEGLPRLEILNLSHNQISEFNVPPLTSNLRIFHFENNPKNNQFPCWLLSERFSNLEELVLNDTLFSSFDIQDKVLPVSHLKKLSMVRCGLSDTIVQLISQSMIDLEYLSIGNYLESYDMDGFWLMPVQNLRNPDKLGELSIQAAGLPGVPQEINTLRNLTRLNISRNNISTLPDEICELKKLEILNAAHNNLYALPQDVGNLAALKVLFLETNKISSLPDSVENLEHLECLDLYNNEFLEVPKQLEKIVNLKALDIEGNAFKTENLQIANIEYLIARNNLRATSNILLLRSNEQKVFHETECQSSNSSLCYEDDRRSNGDNKSFIDTNLSDIASVENWDLSEDSADEYDPTVQRRTYQLHSPFTVSSVFYYGNFCPADLHSTRIRDQLAAMQGINRGSLNIEEGQFDDA